MTMQPFVLYCIVAGLNIVLAHGTSHQFGTGGRDLIDPDDVDSRTNDPVLALVAASASSKFFVDHGIDETLELQGVLPKLKASSTPAQLPPETDALVGLNNLMHDIEFAKNSAVETLLVTGSVGSSERLQQIQVGIEESCSLLSPAEAALVHTGIAIRDIVLLVLVGVYAVAAVGVSFLLRSSTWCAKLRDPAVAARQFSLRLCPTAAPGLRVFSLHGPSTSAWLAQLLTVQILAGLVVMVVVSLPLSADFTTMFRIMTAVEMFGMPRPFPDHFVLLVPIISYPSRRVPKAFIN